MNFLKKLSLYQKFLSVMVVSFSLLILIGVTSYIKSESAGLTSRVVIYEITPAVEALGQLKALFKEFRIAAIKYPTADSTSLPILQSQYSKSKSQMQLYIPVISKVLTSAQVNAIESLIDKYDGVTTGILTEASKSGDVKRGTDIVRDYLVPIGNDFDKTIDSYQQELQKRSEDYCDSLASDISPYTNIVILIIVIVANFWNMHVLCTAITERIKTLAKASAKIAKGNLVDKVPGQGYDEIGDLSHDLSNLVVNLHGIIKNMKDDSQHLNASTKELTDTADNIKDRSAGVLNEILTISTAAEEMVATSQEISSNCSSAASSSEESQRLIEEGMGVVNNTVNDIKLHSEKTKKDAQLILELGNKTQEINSIIATIQEIANQTNLLALNAAIEAASAGEHGKGFAVVADEVRALASRTSVATVEIGRKIGLVKTDVEQANESIIDTVDKMQAIAVNAEELEKTLSVITQKVEQVTSQITQIATATEQQTGTSKDMSMNLQKIRDFTREMADAAEGTVTITSSFNELSDRMETTVNRFIV